MREVTEKSQEQITAEWDALAPTRFDQITSGADLTFTHVLAPAIISLLPDSCETVLDAGCGVGILTGMLAAKCQRVVAIDPSSNSIRLAKYNFGKIAFFESSTIESFAVSSKNLFDVVVANMVLMDVLNLSTFLNAASSLLKADGKLIFSITHPCFWPSYYGYEELDWFQYNKEIIIESPFRISKSAVGSLYSTHVHRPIELYIRELATAGFIVETLDEPVPPANIQNMYPTKWSVPRYLVVRCRLQKSVIL